MSEKAQPAAGATPNRNGCPCKLLDAALEATDKRSMRVLVVLSHDGTVEVYGSRRMQVKIVQRLYPGVLEKPEDEVQCEAYLEATLPEGYRSLFQPRRLLAIGRCERVTAEQELAAREELGCIRELKEMQCEHDTSNHQRPDSGQLCAKPEG